LFIGSLPHVSLPGSPLARVGVEHATPAAPVLMSNALMKHPRLWNPAASRQSRQHLVAMTTFRSCLDDSCREIAVSQRISPVPRAQRHHVRVLVGRKILSPEIAMLRMPP
jgi:hypothetical protein